MEIAHSHRKKCAVIIVSLLIHLFIMLLLVSGALYESSNPIDLQAIAANLNDPIAAAQALAQLQQQQEEWGAMRARASQFGAPVMLVDDVPSAQAHNNKKEEAAVQEATTADAKTPVEMAQADTKPQEEVAPPTPPTPTSLAQESVPRTTQALAATLSAAHHLAQTKKPTQEKPATPLATSSGKGAVTLADIARGFVEQLTHEGENTVNFLGDPSKRPTAEQIKHERYWAKLQWCIQNSFKINQDKYQPGKPINTSVKLYFTLSRDGKMHNLQLAQSSGYRELDVFMLSVFEDASSSFPPIPTFIKQDPYPIMYTVDVFSGQRPWHFARS